MVRGVTALLLVCAPIGAMAGDDVIVLDERPRIGELTLDLAGEVGVLSNSHGTLTLGFSRRLWGERAYVEARLGGGVAPGLAVLELRGGAGLVFRPGERTELLVGWRIGDTYLRGSIYRGDFFFGRAPFRIHLLAVEVAVALQIRIDDEWRLRALPLVPTVFWNGTYGGALGLELGVARAF